MARMIPIEEGISIKELEHRVLSEFKLVERGNGVSLTYWPPDSLDLATGIKTPPVLLTNDEALKYFFTHMKVNGSMNLFATLERLGEGVVEEDRGDKKQTVSGCEGKGRYVSSVGSKANFIDLDDVELVNKVEKFEERMKSASNPTGVGDVSGSSEGIDSNYSGLE
ncbi:hypothetical protein Bca52824_093354 [Brassica carinata]|uniref:Uncharacterized protein n=1 Tax=Brassica carinata TaxID=52824 RepID=A0A8X7P5U8_BRACI|nr:hypothetical protein Bca52824_093354 [Brassica carinata]